ALRRLRARPAGATRLLRPPATTAGGERARGQWGGARGNRRPHLRVWLHSQPSSGSCGESHSARQPRVVGVALCVLPASPELVRRPGAMADRLSARLLPMGGPGSCHFPALVRLPLMPHGHCTDGYPGLVAQCLPKLSAAACGIESSLIPFLSQSRF